MQQNNETWQDSPDAMAYLLKSGHLSDVDIRVGSNEAHQEVFKCHKFVLSAGSPIFEAMFYGDFVEKTQKEIIITDIEPADFKVFLEYIYTGSEITDHYKYSLESLKSFVYIGNIYLRPKFAQFGCEGLEKAIPNLRFFDLVEAFAFTKRMGCKKSVQSILQKLKELTYKTSDLNTAIIDLDFETFMEFLTCINGESVRFNWIEEYVKQNKLFDEGSIEKSSQVPEEAKSEEDGEVKSSSAYEPENSLVIFTENRKSEEEMSTNQCESRDPVIQNWKILLDNINYNTMTIEEIRNGPAKSNLLTFNEKIKILLNRSQFQEDKLNLDLKLSLALAESKRLLAITQQSTVSSPMFGATSMRR